MTSTLEEVYGGYIDSRDLNERLHELEANDDRDEDENEELRELREIYTEGSNTFSAEWESGVTLIPDDQFEDYAREFAEDVGAINKDGEWPSTYIDWTRAASALQMDYAELKIRDIVYWGRG